MFPRKARRMSPGELKAIIGALIGAVCFFLIREFNRKDKIADDLEAAANARIEA